MKSYIHVTKLNCEGQSFEPGTLLTPILCMSTYLTLTFMHTYMAHTISM